MYYEYNFTISPINPWRDILLAHLESFAFDSFLETNHGLKAYILENLDSEEKIQYVIDEFFDNNIQFQKASIKKVNWNEEWEKNFSPILIENRCHIRAEFHPSKEVDYEIIIQPKMSFGTGHHETTWLILNYLLAINLEGKEVLDMGCGTAVLGILAKMKGAKSVDAIDIDDWAVENSLENAKRNSVELSVYKGDAALLREKSYDLILANINKNILLQDIPSYVSALKKGSDLILSGLLYTDFDEIIAVCTKNGLNFVNKQQRNEWISIHLKN